MARRRPLIASVLAATAAMSVPLIQKWEGKSNDPYYDIVGKRTVCYGETNVRMRHYSDAECLAMLRKRHDEFASSVVDLSNNLADKPKLLASMISFSYNIGIENYRTSTARKFIDRGMYKEGCDAMLMWNKVTQNGKKVFSQGLMNRRMDEHNLCIKGAEDAREDS